MSGEIPRLDVFVERRHPERDRDYDAGSHRYRPEYLEPRGYPLIADAFPGVDVEIIDDPEPQPGGPSHQQPLRIKTLKVPADTVAFDFSVRRDDGGFARSTSKPAGTLHGVIDEARPNQPWDWSVTLPGVGTYDVRVKWRNRSGGGPETGSKRHQPSGTFLTVPDLRLCEPACVSVILPALRRVDATHADRPHCSSWQS